MRILYTSDIHVSFDHLEWLLSTAVRAEAEAVIIGGDLIPVWKRSITASIKPQRQWIQEVLGPRLARFHQEFPQISLYLDFGNDDIIAARPLLEEQDGKIYQLLHRRVVPLDDQWLVAGYMGVPPTPFQIKDWEKVDCPDRPGFYEGHYRRGTKTDAGFAQPYELELSHGTIQDDLAQLTTVLEISEWQNQPFILITHSPPWNTALDRLWDGQPVGSLAIRRFIEHWAASGRLRLTLHGHIHESPWVSGRVYDRISQVPGFNVGQEHHNLRALLFDPDDLTGSARLVIAGSRGHREEYVWS